MIKIIKKQGVTEYDVEPKVSTLYYVDKYNKDVIKVENCVFKNAMMVPGAENDANEYWLEYENKELYIYIRVDTTGKVNDDSEYFFDYEQAVSIYKKLRIEFLKDKIDGLKKYQKELKEYQQELKGLEND